MEMWLWIGFNVFVLAMLALDLGVFHRKAHEIHFREAIGWSGVWITLALLFNVGIYLLWPDGYQGYSARAAATAFLTGYLIEKALSVDNIFVFLMLFMYFRVPSVYQHKVLFWGILGALVMRAVFIFAGVALIERFEWAIYVFAILLLVSGVKMIWAKGKSTDPSRNPVLRLLRRVIPTTPDYVGSHFFARLDGRRMATPLLIVLLMVEISDLIFAIDSIPAILGITTNTFIVYTSNVFAILGLRALYFALAGVMQLFHYLHYGLSAILIFVGLKMFGHAALDIKLPVEASLGVIAGVLGLSILASILRPARAQEARGADPATLA